MTPQVDDHAPARKASTTFPSIRLSPLQDPTCLQPLRLESAPTHSSKAGKDSHCSCCARTPMAPNPHTPVEVSPNLPPNPLLPPQLSACCP